MTSPGNERDDIVVIGGPAGSELEVHRNIKSIDQAADIASRVSTQAVEELRIADEKIAIVHREIVTDPDRAVETYILERSRSHITEMLDLELAELSLIPTGRSN